MSDTTEETKIPEKNILEKKSPEKKTGRSKRRFWLIAFTLFLILIGAAYGLYWWLIGRFYESTDDAYVKGYVIPVTTQVPGTIIKVKVDDTQVVNKDQLLVSLDPIDTCLVYEKAKEDLVRTLRNTEQLFINNTGLEASILDRLVALSRAKRDLMRRDKAISSGAVSKEELIHAEETLRSSEALLTQARSAFWSNRALTENTDLQKHPAVQAAASSLRQAYIDYKRSEIRSPLRGEIANRTAQIGQRVAIGTPLMAVVPLEQIWVDANFKEKQIRYMRIGQPVLLTADLYGSKVEYHGEIQGFSAGTGSAFALLPAQNATGNWIKVVQRLPVRIKLDPEEIKNHPLRIGLSMIVTVDLHDTSGPFVSEAVPTISYETDIFESLGKDADLEVAKVISNTVSKLASLSSLSKSTTQSLEKKEK